MGLDKLDRKIEKVVEIVTDIRLSQVASAKDIESNKNDLKEHMRRSDLLEEQNKKTDKKVQIIIYLLLLGAGATASEYAPTIIKYLGLLI